MFKICKTCCVEKEDVDFSKNKNSKDSFQSSCKKCMSKKSRDWALKNKEKVKINKANYYAKNIIKKSDSIKEYMQEWRLNNKDKTSKYNKDWALKNNDYQKKYRKINKEYISKKYTERLDNDFIFKYSHNIRNLIRCSFKRGCKGIYKKGLKTESILGCSIDYFLQFISEKFSEGMNIENHGEWHLDHITPISSAKNEDDLIKLNHYTNFQPLWAKDNLKKGNKLIKEKGL